MKWLLTILTLIIFSVSNPIFSQKLTTYFEENNLKPKASNEGFFYAIEDAGKGAKAKYGDYVLINYKGMLLDGTVFDTTEGDDPFVFRVGHRQVIKGWDLGIQEFKEGGKGTLFVPSKLGYGKDGIGDVIPKHADLIYEIELLDIMDSKAYNQFMKKLEIKERREFEKKKKEQFIADKKIIQKYGVDNKLKTKRLPSGVSYSFKKKKKGKGDTAKDGDFLEVHYEGRLVDGTVFDSSFDGEPFKFQLGRGKVIKGWDDGLKNFKKGSEGWLLIPSGLAYGPRSIREGDIHIPENSVLIFRIKVLKITSK